MHCQASGDAGNLEAERLMMTIPHGLRTGAAVLVMLACSAGSAATQESGFLGAGGGVGIPAGSRSDGMRTGWVTELMVGRVLPGGFASVRVGGMFAQSRIEGMAGEMWMGDPPPKGGTGRIVGGMAGLMAMPRWDWDWYPYLHAGAGLVNARYQGNATSFAWSGGAGAVLKSRTLDFYVEARLLQARRGGGHGEMASVTTGARLPF
jgi:hypothetical protein